MAAIAATLLCYYPDEIAFVMLVRLWQDKGLSQFFSREFDGLMSAFKSLEEALKTRAVGKKLVLFLVGLSGMLGLVLMGCYFLCVGICLLSYFIYFPLPSILLSWAYFPLPTPSTLLSSSSSSANALLGESRNRSAELCNEMVSHIIQLFPPVSYSITHLGYVNGFEKWTCITSRHSPRPSQRPHG